MCVYMSDMQGMDRGYLYLSSSIRFSIYKYNVISNFYCAGGYQRGNWWHIFMIICNQLTSNNYNQYYNSHVHVFRIKVLPDSSFFASFSDNGTTKLWDVNKMKGLHVINKPRLTYSQQGISPHCYK